MSAHTAWALFTGNGKPLKVSEEGESVIQGVEGLCEGRGAGRGAKSIQKLQERSR